MVSYFYSLVNFIHTYFLKFWNWFYEIICKLFSFLVGTNLGAQTIDRANFWSMFSGIITALGFIAVIYQLHRLKKKDLSVMRPHILVTRLSDKGELVNSQGKKV